MRGKWFAVVCSLACTGLHAQATTSESVGELLKLDAHQALQEERKKLGAPINPGTPAPTPVATENGPILSQAPQVAQPVPRRQVIAVTSIYGVGQDLTATVQIDGERIVYRQGARQALNMAGAGALYELVAIAGQCVDLARPSRKSSVKPMRYCYTPTDPPESSLARESGNRGNLATSAGTSRMPTLPFSNGPIIVPAPGGR